VGVTRVGRIFVHTDGFGWVSRKLRPARNAPMAAELSPDQERQAQILAGLLQAQARDAMLDAARLPVASPDSQLLGGTRFEVRDRLLALLADAYETHLGQKKTPPASPTASTALTAADAPTSTRTGRGPS
jgi:hypothetical protein